jgi:ABC-2 type transport system permease protein
VLLGHWVFVHAFRRGLSALGEVPRRTATASPRRATRVLTRSSTRPRTALAALVHKEWLVMRRDSRRLAALIPLCAIAALYPLVAPGVRSSGSTDFWPSVLRGGAVSVMLPFFFTQILAAPAVALEGRAFLLLRLTPVSVTTLLRAKVIAVGVPMTLATAASTLILGIVHHGRALDIAALLLMGAWLAIGATTIGVAGGAIGARFDAEDPRRAVGTGAALTSSLASLAFLGLSVVAMLQIATATRLTGQTVTRFDGGPGAGNGAAMIAGFICVAIAVSIVVVMLSVAQRRLERWQPDGGRAPRVVQPVSWATPPR